MFGMTEAADEKVAKELRARNPQVSSFSADHNGFRKLAVLLSAAGPAGILLGVHTGSGRLLKI